MPYGLYISAAGALAQSQKLEVISNNLANVDTPGFKRDFAVMQARHAEALERGNPGAEEVTMNNIGGGVFMQSTATDFSSGPMQQTGTDTDFAIDGEGFFQVQRGDERLLTRAGNFQFGADGILRTVQGDSVLTAGGGQIAIDPTQDFEVTEGGMINQAGAQIQVGIVKPQSNGDLVKMGDNYFRPLGPVAPNNGNTRVVNGYLEKSSVVPTDEMMQMIQASRAYEANVKLIQNQDSVIGTLVNRILRQS